MSPLEQLIREAREEAEGRFVVRETLTPPPLPGLNPEESEARRQLRICNGCRYCEGFCAVFPAIFRRLDFNTADVHQIANLCHQCGACLHGCHHAPPMAYGINLPRALARVRAQTWSRFAWPGPLGKLYERNGLVLSLVLAAALALFIALVQSSAGSLLAPAVGGFYALLPHDKMVALFAPVFVFALLALAIGVSRFWRDSPPGPSSEGAVGEAVGNVLGLTYLGGGHGEGCNNEDDSFSLAKRRLHHATFYGFMLCFAATVTASFYHYVLGIPAPYDFTTLPKVLGMIGGVSLLVGTIGLWRMNVRRHPLQGVPEHRSMDRGFIAMLALVAASGLLLALARGHSGMPLMLAIHLGAVMALFATMPFSKFAHGVYRGAALLKWTIEKRQPSKITVASD
jgi:citrate/tricarballylate utilization protein